jgi:hypothetical protein
MNPILYRPRLISLSCICRSLPDRLRDGDEECRLLGFINAVLASQETHYISATAPSRLKLLRFEVIWAVTVKNAVFWDIKTKFIPHRKQYVSATELNDM